MGGAPAVHPRPCMRRCLFQLDDGFCRNCGKHNFRKNRCCAHCGCGSEQFFVPDSSAQAQQYLSVIWGEVGGPRVSVREPQCTSQWLSLIHISEPTRLALI
eukprot:9714790-Alexandrium_andersonii.AAC.1